MKKALVTLAVILVSIQLHANQKFFNTRSILFTTSNIISFLAGIKVTPKEVAEKINYKEPNTKTIDEYLKDIADAYSLKLVLLDSSDLPNQIHKQYENNSPIIVIYEIDKRNHSALIAGRRVFVQTNEMKYLINDSALDNTDIIDSITLVSHYWKSKIVRAYVLTK